MTPSTLDEVRALLADALAMGARAQALQADTPLLGHVPELDSAAVVDVLTGLEEQFGISVADDEIEASLFDTVGSLVAFIDAKRSR